MDPRKVRNKRRKTKIKYRHGQAVGVKPVKELRRITTTKRSRRINPFMSHKHEERASHFRPAKKVCVSTPSRQEVTINIGVMEINENEVATPLRGKSLPLKIEKEADYDTLLKAALKKRCAYDQTFDSDRSYKLVYPDGQSAQTIPGLPERFTLVKYKQELGKSYGRITLYLCPFSSATMKSDASEDEEVPYGSDLELSDCDEHRSHDDLPQGISGKREVHVIEDFDENSDQFLPSTSSDLENFIDVQNNDFISTDFL